MDTKNCTCLDPKAAACWLVRISLGLVMLVAGAGKLPNPAAFQTYILSTFKDTILPVWTLKPFAMSVPYVELILGVLLIVGVLRNWVLLVTGLYLLQLVFGLILVKQHATVGTNMTYIAMVAALLFLSEYDRWVICGCCPSRRCMPPVKEA